MKSVLHTLENNLQLPIDPPSFPPEGKPVPTYFVLCEVLRLKKNISNENCFGFFEESFRTAKQSLELPSFLR